MEEEEETDVMTPDDVVALVRALKGKITVLEARLARRRLENGKLRRQLGGHAPDPRPLDDDLRRRGLY